MALPHLPMDDSTLDDHDLDYQAEAYLERFRRENPTWTEEEIQSYHEPHPAMTSQYEDWISENYQTEESAFLKCADATTKMTQKFPELKRVRGHAMVAFQLRPHWWCVTPEGDIVDPTAKQWGVLVAFYEPLISEEEPYGKCLNCGELLFRSKAAGSYMCQDCN